MKRPERNSRIALRIAAGIIGGILAAATGTACLANDFPAKPVRMIIGFPPGGGADIVGRIFADRLGKLWGQQVVVDNRAGAAGVIATEAAARAEPDGYTFFMGTLGIMNTNPFLYKMTVDPARDLAPVSLAVIVHFVLVANPALPVKSVKDLIALAKEKPEQINFSSSGSGGGPHLAGAMFNDMAGTRLVHIPYKGSGPSFTDLLGNQVSLTFDSLVQALPHIQSGKLRALAVLGAKRSPLVPDVPTVAEAGVPGYAFTNWFGFLVPAATPAPFIRKLNADISRVQSDPKVRDQLADMGADVSVMSPEDFGTMIKAESVKWERIIKAAGIKP